MNRDFKIFTEENRHMITLNGYSKSVTIWVVDINIDSCLTEKHDSQ